MSASFAIRSFEVAKDRAAVIALWTEVFGYGAPHNDPALAIEKKCAANDGLLFVAEQGGRVIGTVMAGYDGHRGWIYSLAVVTGHRRAGLGRALVAHAEEALAARGCLKVNLQVLEGNKGVVGFYEKVGYAVEARVSMGKLLRRPEDTPSE